jgi:hypothetical protein
VLVDLFCRVDGTPEYPHFGAQLDHPVDKSEAPEQAPCASIDDGGQACATAHRPPPPIEQIAKSRWNEVKPW